MFLFFGIFGTASVLTVLVVLGWVVYLGLRYTNPLGMRNKLGLFKGILVWSSVIVLLCLVVSFGLAIYAFCLFLKDPLLAGV